jgi:hypothetical protein
MASVNFEDEWKEAHYLLDSTKAEWNNMCNERHMLTSAEIDVIESCFESIKEFAMINCKNVPCLIEFYKRFEELSNLLVLASEKMYGREI